MVLPNRNNTAAVFVAYHPTKTILKAIRNIYLQVQEIIIVDNSPKSRMLLEVRTDSRIKIINPEKNIGVASALNKGVEYALKRGNDFCILFDQDSIPTLDFLSRMANCLSRYPELVSLGLCGCNYQKSINGHCKTGFPGGASGRLKKTKTLITSGCLLPMKTYRKVGQFYEALFIDYVDHEYALRARKYGFKNYVCMSILMEHSVGNITLHRVGSKLFEASNHPAERIYNLHRNLVFCLCTYFSSDPAWCLDQILRRMPVKLTSIFLFENDKKRKFLMALKGIVDGFCNQLRCNLFKRI